jgi:transcription antitermination factor NusG
MMAGASGSFGGPPSIPPDLYELPRWYACYTRARHEKQVEELLRQKGIESFLPLVPRERKWKDRTKVVPFPMFPSYVFGRFAIAGVHEVLSIPGVATIVRTNGYPAAIPEAELENVRRFAEGLAAGGGEPEFEPFVQEGDWVRVREGPFAGVLGIVREVRGRKRVLVGLSTIGQGLLVDMDAYTLEPLPGPPGG